MSSYDRYDDPPPPYRSSTRRRSRPLEEQMPEDGWTEEYEEFLMDMYAWKRDFETVKSMPRGADGWRQYRIGERSDDLDRRMNVFMRDPNRISRSPPYREREISRPYGMERGQMESSSPSFPEEPLPSFYPWVPVNISTVSERPPSRCDCSQGNRRAGCYCGGGSSRARPPPPIREDTRRPRSPYRERTLIRDPPRSTNQGPRPRNEERERRARAAERRAEEATQAEGSSQFTFGSPARTSRPVVQAITRIRGRNEEDTRWELITYEV